MTGEYEVSLWITYHDRVTSSLSADFLIKDTECLVNDTKWEKLSHAPGLAFNAAKPKEKKPADDRLALKTLVVPRAARA
jgi:hypothetical protein